MYEHVACLALEKIPRGSSLAPEAHNIQRQSQYVNIGHDSADVQIMMNFALIYEFHREQRQSEMASSSDTICFKFWVTMYRSPEWYFKFARLTVSDRIQKEKERERSDVAEA